MSKSILSLMLGCGLALTAVPALAHVVISPNGAAPGASLMVDVKAGHSCTKEAGTTAVRVAIPDGVDTAHPMKLEGWTEAAEKKDGRTVALTWTSDTPAMGAVTFQMHVVLPQAVGPVAFNATQTCGTIQSLWDGHDKEHPAPTIVVGGTPTAAAPMHMDHEGHDH